MRIEKSVPLPPPTTGPPRKYPFSDMEVGDCLSLPLSGVKHVEGGDEVTAKLRQAALNYGRRHGKKFVVRTVRPEGIARCWRVE